MDNVEMPQETPEDLAIKIAELTLAINEDEAAIEGNPEKQKRGWDKIEELQKQLSQMVPEDQATILVENAKGRIQEESNWQQAA